MLEAAFIIDIYLPSNISVPLQCWETMENTYFMFPKTNAARQELMPDSII